MNNKNVLKLTVPLVLQKKNGISVPCLTPRAWKLELLSLCIKTEFIRSSSSNFYI